MLVACRMSKVELALSMKLALKLLGLELELTLKMEGIQHRLLWLKKNVKMQMKPR